MTAPGEVDPPAWVIYATRLDHLALIRSGDAMATIFLNYRHDEEAWAGRLHDALEQRFDVFFDTGIKAGSEWTVEIETALKICRVFVVVIGKIWLSQANLDRLREEGDWVRREIVLALARSDLRIVPVLVGETQMPAARLLPSELKPLLGRQWIHLKHAEWKRDVEALREDLFQYLSGVSFAPERRIRIPPVLPHLCDRVEPEDAVLDRVSAAARSRRSFFFVLRGHKAERHDGFIDRLVERRVFESAFRAQATGIAFHRLDWNAEYARQGRFDMLLARGLKRCLLDDPAASEEDLANFLGRVGQPRIFILQVTAADCRRSKDVLPSLMRAWQELLSPSPSGETAGRPVPAQALILWINFSYDAARAQPLSAAEDALLDLGPLEERHIRDWLDEPRVRPYVQGYEGELRRIAEDDDCCYEKGKLHMEVFEEKVHEILGQQ